MQDILLKIEKIVSDVNQLNSDWELLQASATIPYEVDQAFRDRLGLGAGGIGSLLALNSLIGILKGDGAGGFSAIVPLSGTKVYYVSDSSGGAVTRKLTFTNGILTAET